MMIANFSWNRMLVSGYALMMATTVHAQTFTRDEVAKHATKSDCWMIIDDQVYDFTNYLPQHPAAPDVMLKFCGKNATEAWKSKGGIGRPHSVRAASMLEKYRQGTLRPSA